MEVADQWRREWAGTAEYGKVTEGGVTRRIARAMEVLHASGPGARVRVMRAAYHSSAAPGTPAASFMLQSSRRVISSGFNFLEPPSTPITPLEISSTPYESSPEPNTETDNYKVTEPDDYDISEPSKWRGSTRGSSVRMPSEESSSTDNASIIDLDARLGKNLLRKYSYDSESSDIQFGSRNNSRNSPLLDTPVTLSTLKYKSLLNSSNDWNSRRKSYSFEDTAPLNETIIHSNDTLAMESSTDSGICKSTEIVNDYIDDGTHTKSFSRDDKKTHKNEESFRDWLSKNRPISQYRGTKFKTYRDHDIVMEDPIENNITLQSSGKVSITLPVTVEGEGENYQKINQVIEDGERKIKRVEFCKTEVHFTAESGKVNIIETDNKPPPSTDFRKRRSAFVPLQDMIEKPITLFGDKNDIPTPNGIGSALNVSGSELSESDENTAATKSILKNKIPKPKPYLLGENMAFGMSDNLLKKDLYSESKLTAVSLVNKQLEPEKHHESEIKPVYPRDAGIVIKPKPLRTVNTGPAKTDSLKNDKKVTIHTIQTTEATIDDVKNKFSGLQLSPVQRKPKTRQLRESDLTYFGVDNHQKATHTDQTTGISKLGRTENVVENIFNSVKLIQQVSNSVCNSEPESEEAPEYQNIPLNTNYAPVPTPRQRSRHEEKPNEINEIKVYKPEIQQDYHDRKHVDKSLTRRARIRTQHESTTSRSISAPPKALRHNPTEISHRREDHSTRSGKTEIVKEENRMFSNNERNLTESNPIYVNLNIVAEKCKSYENRDPVKVKSNSFSKREKKPSKIDKIKTRLESSGAIPTKEFCYIDKRKEHRFESETDSSIRKRQSPSKDTLSRQIHKDSLSKRSDQADKKINAEPNLSRHGRKSRDETNNEINNLKKVDHRSRSLQRSGPIKVSEDTSKDNSLKKTGQFKYCLDSNHGTGKNCKRNSSKDKTYSTKEIIIPSQKPDLSSSTRNTSSLSKKDEKEIDLKQNKTHKTNKRREYVINYDDKNGTVSSICKVTPPSLGTPKRKKSSKEILKDNCNDNSMKNRSLNKIAPLQLEDHQMERNGLNYADRKWKTKVNVQRSCQVL